MAHYRKLQNYETVIVGYVEMSRDLGTSHVSLTFLRCVEKTESVCVVELMEFWTKDRFARD